MEPLCRRFLAGGTNMAATVEGRFLVSTTHRYQIRNLRNSKR